MVFSKSLKAISVNTSRLLCILRKACVSRGAAGQDGVIPLLYLRPSEVFSLCTSWRAAQSGVQVRSHSLSQTLQPLCRTTINHQLSQTEPSEPNHCVALHLSCNM